MTGKRVGLVIGNNYPNSDKELRFAVADALAMKEVLLNKDICGFDEVIDLVDRTSKEALVEVEKILKRVGSDLVFIYFSGHGKKDFENDLCLLFNDTEEETLLATSLTFDFINKCRRYPSRKSVIIILDCCYSGVAGIRDTSDVMEALKKHSGSGTVILTSTGLTGSPTAKEEEKLGHGIFTYYLIEGLENGQADMQGEGHISIDNLYNYAFEKTTGSCSQSPKKEGSIEGPIYIGKNPLKIRENEYELKKSRLLEYFVFQLPPRVLNESLTILRKNYESQSSLEKAEVDICRLLNYFLDGELSLENYIVAVQHLKGFSIKTPVLYSESDQSILKPEVPNIGNREIYEEHKKHEIPKTFTSPSTGMEFILIPAGKFMMGSPSDEEGRYDYEGPVHEVKIKNSFYLGKYPVIQKQWEKMMGNNPSSSKDEDRPVEMVSWDDVQEFVKRINEKEGADKYRLPSEAEWEYACRAGTQTRYSFGSDESKLNEYAWYSDNSDRKTHRVGQKKPNYWGLYDMHGNVLEWVQDEWHDNYKNAPSDGSAWEDGKDDSFRVNRGGGWGDNVGNCRSANRDGYYPGGGNFGLGFRLLREL